MGRLVQGMIVIFMVIILLLLAIWNLESKGRGNKNDTLVVYNWGDYIDPGLISKFEQESGIRVIYQTFDSNEGMMAKIRQGGAVFDVAFPSEYALEKMKREGMIQPINLDKISNFKHLDGRFLNLPFDKGNEYSVPYFWGTVGIIYQSENINKEITSWNDLWDPILKNQILLIDGAREVVGFSLNSLGHSLNETDPQYLQAAGERLDGIVPNVRALVGDEIKGMMINEEALVGVVWSGDASEIIGGNASFDYVIPEEGSNLWIDNMVIPSVARNVEGAHEFINFMLNPKNNAQNTEYVGYSTPNKTALSLLDLEISSDERFYPPKEITNKLEMYKNIGKENLAKYNELFLQFKMGIK